MKPNSIPILIDSDNALGSPFGDVDDGFAISAILLSGFSVSGLASVFGNTFESWAFKNNQVLAGMCGFEGKVLRGAATWWTRESEAARTVANLTEQTRVLAIGPMTNIGLALREQKNLPLLVRELVFVGTNFSLPLPATRFFDFNHWKDPPAAKAVFRSQLSLTCIPCDIARKLRATEEQVMQLPGELGRHLSTNSRRWFKRARILKRTVSVPVWDLAAAIYVLRPDLFLVKEMTARMGVFGQVHYGTPEGRKMRVVLDFDPIVVWEYFTTLFS